MALLVKKIKNNTANAVTRVGKVIDPGEYYTIVNQHEFLWQIDSQVRADISSGDLVMNDGAQDLSASAGLMWLDYEIHPAINNRFENDAVRSNGFTSENVQEAIEEARDATIGSIWQAVFLNDGSNYSNMWLNLYDDGISSNSTPLQVVWKSKLVGISFSNRDMGTDIDIKIYTVPEGSGNAPKTKIFEWQIRNCRVARKTNFSPSIEVEEGDKLGIFISDQGGNPSDIVVTTYWKILEANEEENCEDYSGNFDLSGGTTS